MTPWYRHCRRSTSQDDDGLTASAALGVPPVAGAYCLGQMTGRVVPLFTEHGGRALGWQGDGLADFKRRAPSNAGRPASVHRLVQRGGEGDLNKTAHPVVGLLLRVSFQ